jgi:hypothetical protein
MAIQQKVFKISNVWDDHAAKFGLTRLPNEDNISLATRIDNLGKYLENSSRQGLINSLSSALGYEQYNVIVRKIYTLTRQPYRDSTFIVKVDGITQTQIYEGDYPTASSGYIVWKDQTGEYTNILEFIDPPPYTRRVDRSHSGSLVSVEYQWLDGIAIRNILDSCNPYDPYDMSFMGWAEETVGSVIVNEISNDDWLLDVGLRDANKVPSEKLKLIWREVDRSLPMTWGE